MQCLKSLVVSTDTDDHNSGLVSRVGRKKEMVHIQQFGRILDWFGPVSKNVTLPPLRSLLGPNEFLFPKKNPLPQTNLGGCPPEHAGAGTQKQSKKHAVRKRREENIRNRLSESNTDEGSIVDHSTPENTSTCSEYESKGNDDVYDYGGQLVDFAAVLPVELSMIIFFYFDEYDWPDLQSVCKSWAAIINMMQKKKRRAPSQTSSGIQNRDRGQQLREKRPGGRSSRNADPRTLPHLSRGNSTGDLLSKVKKPNKSSSASNQPVPALQHFKSSLLTRNRVGSSNVEGSPVLKDQSIYCMWDDEEKNDEDDSGLECTSEHCPKKTILDTIFDVLTKKWFHGELETTEATYLIQNYPQGTFLVRFSTNATHPGAFTVTRVAGGPSIGHIRITRSEDGKGRFIVNKDLVFDSLVETIENTRSLLGLTMSCPGSPYQKFFASS